MIQLVKKGTEAARKRVGAVKERAAAVKKAAGEYVDVRTWHSHGGLLILGVGAALYDPPAGLIVLGLGLFYLGARR